ncbi:MAG: TAXI family TRAP transporter solute-binding subunit [Beijerinckiaceae bacterium]|nr:TAXI family TRAP transporter solute-binding subunit [Beijerinckiaceae bacterium]
MSKTSFIRAVGVALLALAGVGSVAQAQVTFATGRQGGSQYPVSVALSQILEKAPGVGSVTLVPGGGAANIVAVDIGKADLGITLSNSARDGLMGKPPYKAPTPNIVQLFALQAFKVVVIVPENSPIKTFADLQGKKVNTGPKGFTIVEVADQLFKMENIKVNMHYLQIGQAIDQFKDGNIDALVYSPSDRFAAFMDLAQTRKIRLVPLPDRVIDAMIKGDPSFYRSEWPAYPDSYKGLSNKVPTLGYPNIIIANKNKITDQQAYEMTKITAENLEKVAAVEPDLINWDLKNLATEVGLPVHPGSMRYFKEKGWR